MHYTINIQGGAKCSHFGILWHVMLSLWLLKFLKVLNKMWQLNYIPGIELLLLFIT